MSRRGRRRWSRDGLENHLHGHAGFRRAHPHRNRRRRPRGGRGLYAGAKAGGTRPGGAQSRRSIWRPKASAFRCARPKALRNEDEQAAFAALDADVAVVVAYGLILPQADPRGAPPRLPQPPRLAAAALARRGADPARGAGGRRAHRRHGDADGRGARHRARRAGRRDADRPRHDHRRTARPHDAGRRRSDGPGARRARARLAAPSRRRPKTASPTPKRSRRPRRASTGRKPAAEVHNLIRGMSPFPGAWFELRARRRAGAHQGAALDAGGGRRGAGHDPSRPHHCLRGGRGAPRHWCSARARPPWTPQRSCAAPGPAGSVAALMPRYKLVLEYDGTPFAGWQRQADLLSVQQVVEDAIEKMSGETRCHPGGGAHRCRRACARAGGELRSCARMGPVPHPRGAELPHQAASGGDHRCRGGARQFRGALLGHRPALRISHPQPPRPARARRLARLALPDGARCRGDA